MRNQLIALLLAVGMPGLALAQGSNLPGASLADAGEAATLGLWVCGIPSSQIDAFARGVNDYVPGGTSSADYVAAQAQARQMLDELRKEGSSQDEIRQSRCPGIISMVTRIGARH